MIAIIAILASLLLPALNKVRDKAKIAKCQGNLKQMSYGFFSYGEDNDEQGPENLEQSGNFMFIHNARTLPGYIIPAGFPPGGSGTKFFKGIIICPGLTETIYGTSYAGTITSTRIYSGYGTGYGTGQRLNAWFGWQSATATATRAVACPNTKDLGRSITSPDNGVTNKLRSPSEQPLLGDIASDTVTSAHNQHCYGYNNAFFDGHITYSPYAMLTQYLHGNSLSYLRWGNAK